MNDEHNGDPDLAAWRRAYRADLAEGTPDCPGDESLAALVLGELPPEERDRLADHVAACRRCSAACRDLLDLHREGAARFPAVTPAGRRRWPWAAAAAGIALLALAGWNASLLLENRQLSSRLAAEAEQAGRRERETEQAAASREEIHRQLEGLAELGDRQAARIAELEREMGELRGPRLNVPIVDLDPRSVVRGAGGGERVIRLPAGAELVTLILHLAGPPSHPAYEVEIQSGDGERIWSGAGLVPDPNEMLSIAVPRSFLPPGRYRIRLHSQGRLVESYEIRIESAD